MGNNMWKKGMFLIIMLFVAVCNTLIMNGNVLSSNYSDDKKTDSNDEYINSCNKLDYPNDYTTTKDGIFVTSDQYGSIEISDVSESTIPHINKNYGTQNAAPPILNTDEYTLLNPDSKYDYSDNSQSLRVREISRPNRVNTPDNFDDNILVKNKAISTWSNPTTFDKNIFELSIIDSGNIFYVGGSGPNNYTSIQEAIDDANNGDTIFVYDDSSPYHESLVVDKSISLIGENKDTTIINGSKLDVLLDIIEITANNVYINGFSITENMGYYYQAAIKITGDYSTISNCKLYDNNWLGISLLGSFYSQIIDCELYDNLISIQLVDSNENEIRNCLCYDNADDILLYENSHNNQIINCECIGNGFSGIHVQRSSGNQILNCTINNGYEGIGLAYAPDTTMRGNVLNNNYENFGIGSSSLSDFFCDIDTTNTINGKPIYYWIDQHNKRVPSDAGFVGLVSCTNILVIDLEISNNFQGIVCAGVSNCIIKNSNFGSNGGHGVFFVSSSDNTIRNCSGSNNFFSGIYLISQSNSNIVLNCTFTNIQVCGIWSEESTGNYIRGHKINNCLRGILLDISSSNVLRDNDMVNCGLAVDGNVLSDYINDVDTSNTVNGKTLYYYIDKNNVVVPNDAGEVILVNCTYCNITNLDLSDGTIGVILAFSSYNDISENTINGNGVVAIDLDCSGNNYNMIKGNTIQDNNYAIDVDYSCCNTFSDNTIYDNGVAFSFDSSDGNFIIDNDIQNSWNGIYLSESSNNELFDNTIQNCGFNAIYLLYSNYNTLKGNEMVNCGLLVYGFSLTDYINDVDTSNTVNGKPLYYYINENNIVVPNDAGEVILVNCNYCNVTNLDLSDGTIGVELAYSNHNTVTKNTLNNNNFAGIYLESSNENTVGTNTIENNGYGISMQLANSNDIKKNIINLGGYGCYVYLSESNTFSGNNILYCSYGIYFNLACSNNNIYYNNLIGNGYNAWDENEKTNNWDNGERGNYWADYEEKYPNAKKIWLKGIWNTPYDIPLEENQDRYPLIIPYIGTNVKTVNLVRLNLLERILTSFQFLKQLLAL